MNTDRKKRVLTIFGTRPEAIKMAPVIKILEKNSNILSRVCVTAQHREMLDQVLNIFDIKPDYDLNLMKKNQDLYDITANVLLNLKSIFMDFKPDLVLVHGDTTTSAAAALAAYYQQIKVGHIEAGLRTYNIYNPWPEEINRQITGVIANYHFTPTEESRKNLISENKDPSTILVSGNTVIDSLFFILNKFKNTPSLEKYILELLKREGVLLNQKRKFILITSHRRENFGEGFINMCEALKSIALTYPNIDIIYPVHLNPNVQKPVKEILSSIDNIYLIKPLQYDAFVYLMNQAYFIITDSGGVQEEAPSLGKPVLVLRNTTERPEAISAGTVKLIGTNKEKIIQEIRQLLDNRNLYLQMSQAHNPYGDGKACQRISDFIQDIR